MIFKPGDKVKFSGVKDGSIQIKTVTGKLILVDENTSIKGILRIKNDKQRMMFCQDGTIYCHPRFGVVLSRVKVKAKK